MLINVLAPWLVFCGVFVVSPSMPDLWLVTARNLWKSGKFTKKFSTSEKKGAHYITNSTKICGTHAAEANSSDNGRCVIVWESVIKDLMAQCKSCIYYINDHK
jgi:hypothetical protein